MRRTFNSALSIMIVSGMLTACVDDSPARQDSFIQSRKVQMNTQSLLTDRAFNADIFFSGPIAQMPRPELSFLYTGDDSAWPVWAMALKNGCPPENKTQVWYSLAEQCKAQWTARVIRAPGAVYHLPNGTKKQGRMRSYGARFTANIHAELLENPDFVIEQAVEKHEIEWLEADLSACPSALKQLERYTEQEWTLDIINGARLNGYLHADRVHIKFDNGEHRLDYSGVPAKHNPALWAVELYKAIEPCLAPSKAILPWRVIKPD